MSSDSAEDTGRRESEAALKASIKPSWLSNCSDLPLSELRTLIQEGHNELLAIPLQVLVHEHTAPNPANTTTGARGRPASEENLLKTSNALLGLYDSLNQPASETAAQSSNSAAASSNNIDTTDLLAQIEGDKTRLAALLESGRRALAAEYEGRAGGEGERISEQVRELFGLGGVGRGDGGGVETGGVGEDLVRVERAVKRIGRIVGNGDGADS